MQRGTTRTAAEEDPPRGDTSQGHPASQPFHLVSQPLTYFPTQSACKLAEIHLIMCWDLLIPGSSPWELQRLVFLLQKQTITLRGCAS